MTLFYSAQTGGFYDDDIHGTRTVLVNDPSWVRPLITITLQPGERYQTGEQLITNDTEEPLTVENVPDAGATHPMIEVANPNCRLPADTTEISAERHAELLSAQAAGQRIQPGVSGAPTAVDPPDKVAAEFVAEAKALRRACLDSHAKSAGVSAVYAENLTAAQAQQAGAGATTAMRNGQTATAYLETLGAPLGMDATVFAAYIVGENASAAIKAAEVEAEYMRLAYAYLPTATTVDSQAAVNSFRTYCDARAG